MTLYKFLGAGATAPFSRFRWPAPQNAENPGDWVVVRGPVEPCRSGLHLCRETDLPFWISEELYTVEVDGPVQQFHDFVVARRARLVRRVESWEQDFAGSFSSQCVQRLRDLAAGALRDAGRGEAADRLLECDTVEDVLEAMHGLFDGGVGTGPLTGYLLDCAHYAMWVRSKPNWPAQAAAVALIAATAARAAAGPEQAEAAVASERARQAAWLTDHVLAVV